jgi:hypothetical protein
VVEVRTLTCSLLLLFTAAHARAGTVALVEPDCSSEDATETLSRLHGELLSVGLEVNRMAPPQNRDPAQGDFREWVSHLASTRDVDAVIDIVCDPKPLTIDVWIVEQSAGRIELSRVVGEPNSANAAERLAIRTIDLLRSSFIASDIFDARRAVAKSKESTPALEQTKATTPASSLGVELGASVLTGTDRIGPAFLPLVAIDWTARSWLDVRAAFAGFGTRPAVSSESGSASVAQHYGLLGLETRFRSGRWLTPTAALSAGVLRTSVRGAADPPQQAQEAAQWSLLLDGSAGATVHLSRRYYLTLAAHVQLAEPYVAIRLLDAVVATSGRPNLALTATVGAWL